MKHLSHTLAFVALTLAVASCSDDSNNNNEPTDAGPDVVEADTSEDADAGPTDDADAQDSGDTEDTGDDADITCTPRTQCSADECGTVDDGCGGPLDCGVACNCVDGEPQGTSCGECGVGSYQCAPGETGQGTCAAPDLPGLDESSTDAECEASLVYVDPLASQGGEGEKSTPYTNYMNAVQDATAGQILLLTSDAEYTSGLVVNDGVSHIGGFESGTWAFNPDAPSVVNTSASLNGPTIGVDAENITQQTVLAHFDIKTEAAGSGQSTYGVVAVDADALELRNVTVAPGDAGDGRRGSSGDDGADGGDGTSGSSGLFNGIARGGQNPSCPSAEGGSGGNGAMNPNQISGAPTPGEDSPGGAAGGSAGTAGTDAEKAGEDGENGMNVTTMGTDGTGGLLEGQLVDNRWAPGGDGEDGGDGVPGIGGGGGGGSWHGPQYCTEADGDIKYYAGAKAASGGAGGCGGEGGQGGQAGGASFGLLLIRSDISVVNSSITAGNAGDGGDGGRGGVGGLGGTGGTGVGGGEVDGGSCDPPKSNDNMSYAFFSGDGGDGSDGTPGGAGGGGAGGVSYGTYCEGAAPTIDPSSTISAGTAGAAGAGPGNPGEAGEALDQKGCQ